MDRSEDRPNIAEGNGAALFADALVGDTPVAADSGRQSGQSVASRRLMQLSSRLVRVDRRNPTIRLLKKPKERAFDLASAEAFRAGAMRTVLEKILADKPVTIVSNADRPRGAENDFDELEEAAEAEGAPKRTREEYRAVQAWRKLSGNLTSLRRKKNSIYEESGSQDFYLGFPWISGTCNDSEGTFLQAPLLLFPVDLTVDRAKGVSWQLSPAQNEYPIFNTTLVQALEHFDNSVIPATLIEEAEAFADDKSIAKTPEVIIEWLGRELARHGIDISLLSYAHAPLPEFKADQVPKATRGFEISANVVFGCFPLSNSALAQDYEAMRALADDENEELPTVLSELLAAEATEDPLPPLAEGEQTMDGTPEAETCFVLPSDSSQEEVLLQARQSHCLVVHGPPGTGKSQVIVNLVSDALARHERVLVCCQKRAALDVVFQRLDKYGLSRHCAIVHDAANDRKELYGAIARAMDSEQKPGGGERDLKQEIAHLATTIDRKTAELKAMAEELHKSRRCGMRARELYTRCASLAPAKLDVGAWAASGSEHELRDLLTAVSMLAKAQANVNPNNPWVERTTFAALSAFDRDKVAATLNAPQTAAAKLIQACEALAIASVSPADLVANQNALALLETWQGHHRAKGATTIYDFLRSGSPSTAALERSLEVLREHLPSLAQLPPRPKARLSPEPGPLAYRLEAFLAKRKGLLRFLDGEYREAKKAALPYLGAQGIEQSDAGIGGAIADLRSQQRWDAFDLDAKDLEFNEGFGELSRSGQIADFVTAFENGLAAFRTYSQLQASHGDLLNALESAAPLEVAASKLGEMRAVIAAFGAWQMSLKEIGQWLRPEALAEMVTISGHSPRAAADRIAALQDGLQDFDDLLLLDSELAKLNQGGRDIYRRLVSSAPESTTWREQVESAVLFAWLEEVERESPMLREVSSPSFANTQHTFVQDIEARRTLNQYRLQRSLFGAATEYRFEPGRVTDGRHSMDKPYRELLTQVSKKSRLWSLRRLVSTYWWPLREIMPVWLVSPETLSAAFPLEKDLFDLVIFDEASQCAVEHGLPATYRGKRVVIAGDEQQLQPSMHFQTKSEFIDEDDASAEDESEDSEAVEADSILRLARTRFPQRMLTWHYRSKFEELIDFSNHGFYDGRLKTVPDTIADIRSTPIRYIKVADGAWRERANRPEGERVVDEIYSLLLKHGDRKSIGVITFNVTQREMILNIIDKRSTQDAEFAEVFARAFSPPSGNLDDALFVKNIENVQGDERDIIIFSIGYGKAEDGRVRASFGSLSQAGGENRLNVAVSRSREEIVVIASIEPEELNVANSKNRGPRLIRSYLEYARAVSKQSEDLRQAVLRDINPAQDTGTKSLAGFESPFEEQVFEALTARGLRVDTQVGVSGYRLDLAIVDPNMASKYVLGIECDGATYHSAPSVRERDAYRQRFLESRGWVMHRIWSRNWWRNSEREIEAILALVAKHQSPEVPNAAPLDEVKEEVTTQGYQGEWPPQGEIRAWLEEVRDGFHWFAIADFGKAERMDLFGWAKDKISARWECEKAQVTWLGDHQMAPNQYLRPRGSESEGADE